MKPRLTVSQPDYNSYQRPSSVFKNGEMARLVFEDQSESYLLDSLSVQVTLLQELIAVHDMESAIKFLSLNGALSGSRDEVHLPSMVQAATSVRLCFDLLKAIQTDAIRLMDHLFLYDEASFAGEGHLIRESRKTLRHGLKKYSLPAGRLEGRQFGFAPSSVASEFHYIATPPDSLKPSAVDWKTIKDDPRLLSPYYLEGVREPFQDIISFASETVCWLIELNCSGVQQGIESNRDRDGKSKFELIEYVSNPWQAAHLALRDLAIERDSHRPCPRPGCTRIFEVTRTNKKNCGRAACEKYVQRTRS